MPSSSVLARAGRGFLALFSLAGSLPAVSAASLASLNSALVTMSPVLKLVSPGLADANAELQGVVALAEAELVQHLAGQELAVARIFDLHLAEHLVKDDLNVLVVDLHALGAVDVLHLVKQVLEQRLLALDAEDVVRDGRAVDERIAGFHEVAGVDLQLLVLRDVVLAFHARIAADDDGHLAAALLGAELDGAGDFRQHGRVLGLAGLEDFGDAGQTTDDVHRAAGLARLAGEHVAGLDHVAIEHFDTSLGGQVVEVEDLAVIAHDGDARMALALVLDDDQLRLASACAALALFFEADGFAFFDVFVLNLAALFRQNRRDVGVPAHQLLARLDLLAVLHQHGRAVGNLVLLDLAALGVEHRDFTVALQGDKAGVALGVLHGDGVDVAMLHGAAADALDVVLDQRAGRHATGVERAHRQLRARLTDRLGADDADREAFFDLPVGAHVDAVAAGADAAWGFAGQRAADAGRFELQIREACRPSRW